MGGLSWIICVGPKYNKCVLVNGEVEDLTQRRGESSMITEAEIEVIWPQAKGYQQPPHQKLQEGGKNS